jgi:quinol monooxygenase YgiN
MFGLIVRLAILPGKRDEMAGILKSSAAEMPGCFSYVVAEDCADENVIWVTEVCDGIASHDASLSLPSVKSATARARELVSSFEKIAVTSPVWGVGLPTSGAH